MEQSKLNISVDLLEHNSLEFSQLICGCFVLYQQIFRKVCHFIFIAQFDIRTIALFYFIWLAILLRILRLEFYRHSFADPHKNLIVLRLTAVTITYQNKCHQATLLA